MIKHDPDICPYGWRPKWLKPEIGRKFGGQIEQENGLHGCSGLSSREGPRPLGSKIFWRHSQMQSLDHLRDFISSLKADLGKPMATVPDLLGAHQPEPYFWITSGQYQVIVCSFHRDSSSQNPNLLDSVWMMICIDGRLAVA
ncbi:hypothetical protein SAY86_028289 [Trapa natans]|uniref:Uncharacterized protein n=1 Tax=Trapa natans TaxID=22666 RepID=A0AAN7RG95_TRANT|nr:hypothetical protein SAY86_028289 [Trapa natans]